MMVKYPVKNLIPHIRSEPLKRLFFFVFSPGVIALILLIQGGNEYDEYLVDCSDADVTSGLLT